jgi:anionic cell wall polymer biosynthesis LytR-Cps2A-Psr (LCP) family protein
MAGQAPYLINGYFNISNAIKSISANVSYNVQGETLNVVGSGNFPDVYTKPFQSLNLNINKHLGNGNKSVLTVGLNNILKSEQVNYFKSHEAGEEVYSIFKPGRTISVKYSYAF